MKATGIVRRIDDLGRVVIPKEIRRTLCIREGDPFEIYTTNDGGVMFKKYVKAPEDTSAAMADYANKNHESIVMMNVQGDKTIIAFKNGRTASVKKYYKDKFDMNAAICYALAKAGYTFGNPVCK